MDGFKYAKDYPVYKRLEEFSCPMCGAVEYALNYCKGNSTPRYLATLKRYTTDEVNCIEDVIGQHLHLRCTQCGYNVIRKGVQDGTPDK